jgi:hypothetical protein
MYKKFIFFSDYEIDAHPRVNSDQPFTNIKSCSFNKEDEILFLLGSIFQNVVLNRGKQITLIRSRTYDNGRSRRS